MDKLQQIQEHVFDYFKDTDNETLVKVIESFSFHKGTDDGEVSDLITQFLKDSDLEEAYLEYYTYIINPETRSSYFRGGSPSQHEFIENVKTAFLVLAFNRLRQQY